MVPIANRILDRYEVIPRAEDRGRLLGSVLYKYNYDKTLGRPVFRTGAGPLLATLGGTRTWIVTNSDTHAVAGKVAALDQPRQPVGQRGLDLAAILAQFGRDPRQPQRAVDVLFAGRHNDTTALEKTRIRSASARARSPACAGGCCVLSTP